MSNYLKIAEENGDRYLSALEKGQENFLQYVTALNQWTPQPTAAMPGIVALRAFSNFGFEFSEKLLEQQKAFTQSYFAQTSTSATPATKSPKASGTTRKATKARRAAAAGNASKASKAGKSGGTGAARSAKTADNDSGKEAGQAAGSAAKTPEVTSSKKKPVARARAARVSKS